MKISYLYAAFLSFVLLLTGQEAFASEKITYAGSFDTAKRWMYQVYEDNQFDQYCGCPYTRRGSGGQINPADCGYQVRGNQTRATRTEAEHVVAAENLGRQFVCWREGGRDHCNNTDLDFRNAHNDLHNLIPVIGEVNANRSNYRFDMIAESKTNYTYGACTFKVDPTTRRAEPSDDMKGDVARANLYMRDQHGLRLSSAQERLFDIWHRADPVSDWERIRDERIRNLQGNSNHWVTGDAAPTKRHPDERSSAAPPVQPESMFTGQVSSALTCETRKFCSQMSSCEEAMYHLNTCGNTRLDGNGDGVPCEAICR